MLVCGLDFETTGLDLKNDRITEVGAVLWDTDRNVPVRLMSQLIYEEGYPELTPEIIELTGIHPQDLTGFASSPKTALVELLGSFFNHAEAIVAHNGLLFDKPMLEEEAKRQGVKIPERIWIDTTTDIEFPPHITTRKLTHLASDHKFLNPFEHRALFDVCAMLKIASQYDWNQMMTYAKTPTLTVRADTTFQQKELAKKQNYRWNAEQKIWVKSIKEFQLEETRKAAQAAGFGVTVLTKGN